MKNRVAGCVGKYRYETYTQAARGSHLPVYKCKFCNGFHKGKEIGKAPTGRRLREEHA